MVTSGGTPAIGAGAIRQTPRPRRTGEGSLGSRDIDGGVSQIVDHITLPMGCKALGHPYIQDVHGDGNP